MNQGDAWKIETIREAVSSGETDLVAKSGSGGEEIRLKARLLPREREVLLVGGKLKYLRERSEEPDEGATTRVSETWFWDQT